MKIPKFTLEDKIAVVTGAARGIGREIALVFAHSGAHLILVDLLKEELMKTTKEIDGIGRRSLSIAADISNTKEIERLVTDILNKFNRIDILVNNAGVIDNNPATEVTEEQWDKTLNVNLKGLFFLSQAVGRHMIKERRGKIINIASQAGVIALENHAAYSASKAGIISITKTLALEWGKFNINVNAIAPTVILTPLGKKAWADPQIRSEMLKKIPLELIRRIGPQGGICIGSSSEVHD
ncbi:MAG TPA: SDR family NAD(P)-dependent oxidoreductase, partial [candidate division CPR3 bacterium]|nr:SDR family NAD(P)-dependent oxidoreductase [candidate division CPR3 bacterium]